MILVLAAVIVAMGLVAWWRRAHGAGDSVAAYHRTVDLLREVKESTAGPSHGTDTDAEHRDGSYIRILPTGEEPPGSGGRPARPAGAGHGTHAPAAGAAPAPDTRLRGHPRSPDDGPPVRLFQQAEPPPPPPDAGDDSGGGSAEPVGDRLTGTPDRPPMPPASRPRPRVPARRRRRRRRPRRATVTVLSVTVVAVAVAVAVAGSTGEEDDSTPTTAPPESTVVDQPTTTATAAPPAAPQVVASDDSGSRYTIATSPFTVQLTFTGLCWVELRRGGSDGEVLLSGTFESGNSPTFTESSIWIRLGYPPAATVTVNGVALPPISGTNNPFNLEIAAGSPPG